MSRRLLVFGAAAFWLACGSHAPESTNVLAPTFEEVAEQTGLRFQHFIGAMGNFYLPEIMGSGVALIDYDSDGDLDVYLLQGALLEPDPALPTPTNVLFRNEMIPAGELRFTDVTEAAGVGDPGYGMGAAVGDYDGDGDSDLFVTNFGPNVLYRNNGDGTFSDATVEIMKGELWSTSAAFLDYDRDGDLDLAFANYVDFTPRTNKECYAPTGSRDYCSPTVYAPVPDRLLRNGTGGRWTDVSVESGWGQAFGNGLGLVAGDLNDDGWMDVYVANDGTANQLWMNRGDGTFQDTALRAGAAYNIDGMPEAGMGIAAADFDSDGDEDLFVTHLKSESSTLYVNDGLGNFQDMTARFGLGSISMAHTGFGVSWLDYDLDGFLDLFVANGAVTIEPGEGADAHPFRQRNQLYRYDGERFVDFSDQAGEALALEDVSRGVAAGDLDLDGDQDLVVSNNNGPARLLLNLAGDGNRAIRLRVTAPHARVALLAEDGSHRWTSVRPDGSYLSASEAAATFAVGSDRPRHIGVIWPDGSRETFENVSPGETVWLRKGAGRAWNE